MDQYNLGAKVLYLQIQKKIPLSINFSLSFHFSKIQDLKTNSPYSMPCISYSYACSCKNYTLDHALFLCFSSPSPPFPLLTLQISLKIVQIKYGG